MLTVEDDDSEEDTLGGNWDISSWGLGLGCCHGDILDSSFRGVSKFKCHSPSELTNRHKLHSKK